VKRLKDLAGRFRVTDGARFRLSDWSPADTAHFKSESHARRSLEQGVALLSELQQKLYAQGTWAVLLILQGIDSAGKDGTIKHVMSGVNPQGCEVHSFKAPSEEELEHDFLWRAACRLPRSGRIGIFNRSYYEEVLVVRVHPEMLEPQRIPPGLVTKKIWDERCEDITSFERHLSRNGVLVLKFFLNLSKDEQRRRFMERLDEPQKNWKFSAADIAERQYWDAYVHAYEEMIRRTATDFAPWYVVPADNKWFTRLVVAEVAIDALTNLHLAYPTADAAALDALKEARTRLQSE
jgi:PPK2 family polyphosphate:nucleotide phosphotransferase